MSKVKTTTTTKSHANVHKLTNQGGRAKTSSMSKDQRKSYKKYRGQGR